MNHTFAFHSLPYEFNFATIRQDVHKVIMAILSASGYRFTCYVVQPAQDSVMLRYRCSQDKAHEKPELADETRQRDSRRMPRYQCHGNICINVDFKTKTLTLRLTHIHHVAYVDRELSSDVMKYINRRAVYSKTPSELYNEIVARVEFCELKISQKQVKYHWRKVNEVLWRRSKNVLLSTRMLLGEFPETIKPLEYDSGNVRAIGFIVEDTRKRLAQRTEEAVIDATFGTNESALDLFAVLVEFDGTGVPLAYLFLEVSLTMVKFEHC